MSENSIDVDVNFHLNDINKLFEKIMEGAGDTDMFKGLSDISEIDDDVKASLLGSISSIDNKTKLFEALTNLSITAPIVNDWYKMIEEMSDDGDERSTIIERTQKSMVTLLSLSKTMLILFEEKFPISLDMQKELDIMNDTLNNQNLVLDDKMDILLRSINNMVAPIKEERQAFKVTEPKGNRIVDMMSRDTAIGQIDTMIDFVNQIITRYEGFIKGIDEGEGRFRLAGSRDGIQNELDIANEVKGLVEEYRISLDESRDQSIDLNEAMSNIPAEANLTFDVMQGIMVEISEIFSAMKETLDTMTKELDESLHQIVADVEKVEINLDYAVEALNEATGKIEDVTWDFADVFEKEIVKFKKEIHSKEDEDFYKTVVQDILNQLIKEELVQPLNTTKTAQDLEYILKIAEASLNTLNVDLERLMVGKSDDELRDMGLSDIAMVKGIIARARERQKLILRDEGTIFSSPLSRDIDTEGLSSLDRMQGLLEVVATRTREQDNMTVKISDNLSELLIHAQSTNMLAQSSFNATKEYEKTIDFVMKANQTSINTLSKFQEQTKFNTDKIRIIAERWSNMFPNESVDTSET